MRQAQLFAGEAEIEGFRYADGLFSPAEEKAFVRGFESLPFEPFEFHGYLGNRRVVSFGWRYDYSGARLRKAEAVPQFLSPLAEIAAHFGGVEPEAFAHLLVTEYAPGAGIGWHRDKTQFGKVVGLSFCSPCRLRFRRKQGQRWETLRGRCGAAFGLSAGWRGTPCLGTQHPAHGGVALFGDLSHLGG